jgi:protein-S-isoprenylcysteine O-methyltransferase Ste14
MHIPPPVYMVLAIMSIFYGQSFFPLLSFGLVEQKLIGIFLGIVGVVISIVSVQRFRQFGTTIQPHKLDEAKHLVSDGIYNYSRNPMYLGMAILIVSAGIYVGSFLFLPALVAFVLIINKFQIAPEEAALERLFGQEYLDFKMRTRRWI